VCGTRLDRVGLHTARAAAATAAAVAADCQLLPAAHRSSICSAGTGYRCCTVQDVDE
jgi:hypothetical protein